MASTGPPSPDDRLADRPDNRQSYRPGYETTAERIVGLIAERGLQPGDRLPTEQELATELGVTRGVVRDAVKILTALGRVSAHRGRGLFVGAADPLLSAPGLDSPPFVPGDPAHVEELLRFRRIQDVAAAGEAAHRATPPDLRALRDQLDRGQQALADGDQATFDDADTRFHVAVASAAQNRFLAAAVANARGLQQQVVLLGLGGGPSGDFSVAHAEHVAIYAAIAGGRPDRAERAAAAHIDNTIQGFRVAISRALADSADRQKGH